MERQTDVKNAWRIITFYNMEVILWYNYKLSYTKSITKSIEGVEQTYYIV